MSLEHFPSFSAIAKPRYLPCLKLHTKSPLSTLLYSLDPRSSYTSIKRCAICDIMLCMIVHRARWEIAYMNTCEHHLLITSSSLNHRSETQRHRVTAFYLYLLAWLRLISLKSRLTPPKRHNVCIPLYDAQHDGAHGKKDGLVMKLTLSS